MHQLVLFVVLLFALPLATAGSPASASGSARIKDADTIEVAGKIFRLHGIDSPEFDQACLDAEGSLYSCGAVAAQELQKFIADRVVRCDDLNPDPTYPARRIGRCSVDGTDLHHWLVSHGWALNFEPYEEDAKRGHYGMWKGCFVTPRDFRRWNVGKSVLRGPACPQDAKGKLFPDVLDMPPGCEIKGHFTPRAFPYRGIYHLPGCRSYRRTKAKRWFCSEPDALAARFRKALTCSWP
jgi:endonuclease YncB( thermonuclease family)